nr:cobalamin biosynthesis protein [uncultured Neokomagataea sp.]
MKQGGYVAGLGARPGVEADDIVALLRGVLPVGVRHLAVPAFRSGEIGILHAAEVLGLDILWIGAAALAERQKDCMSHSARVQAAVGFSSVAEGCALVGAGLGSVLLVPKQVGRNVTCAVAVSGGD